MRPDFEGTYCGQPACEVTKGCACGAESLAGRGQFERCRFMRVLERPAFIELPSRFDGTPAFLERRDLLLGLGKLLLPVVPNGR
jgi:hypothetical protein